MSALKNFLRPGVGLAVTWLQRGIWQIKRPIRLVVRMSFFSDFVLPMVRCYFKVRKAHEWLPDLSAKVAISKHLARRKHWSARRRQYGNTPSQGSRSAFLLGQYYQMLEAAEDSLLMYQEIAKSAPEMPSFNLIRKTKKLLQTENRDALYYHYLSVELAPNYAEAQCELGRLLLLAGSVDDAIAHLELVPTSSSYQDPDREPENISGLFSSVFVKGWYWLGQAYETKGDLTAAISCYIEILSIDSACPIACDALAELQVQHGAYVESLEHWLPAISYHPITVALPRSGRDLSVLPTLLKLHLSKIADESDFQTIQASE